MDNKRFEVINGNKHNKIDKDLYEPIKWERGDSGQKVMSIKTTSLKATMSEEKLRLFIESLKANPSIRVTYSCFDEEEKQREAEKNALEEMFKDNDKVIVFDSKKHNKRLK